ncbi:glycosyltransferase [Sphingobium naphthae]|uniref:Glycosyltransferase n=2 Tax=Sphingobium TaxID=165695 RepID=A0A9X7UER5_SPHYA|nr:MULTISPECIES: glycosyltransferase [Sphingobium]MDV5825841.1 glycosyltransferase [Sphingobium naphthae]QNG47969.1 glycosyltransferase [Sphingobium yanoikuyae]
MIKNLLKISAAKKASRQARKSHEVADWQAATKLWAGVAAAAPRSIRAGLQYAHALRRSGNVGEACDEYRRVIALAPDNATAWTGLGVAYKAKGERTAALDAFVKALRIDPGATAAQEEIIRYGGRDTLPGAIHGEVPIADSLQGLRSAIRHADGWLDQFRLAGAYPIRDYGAFRQEAGIAPPRGLAAMDEPLHVVIDAQGANAAQLRITMQSLLRQSHPLWTAEIIGAGALADHPVGSLARIDPRLQFSEHPHSDNVYYIHISAGTLLHGHALAWFGWTVTQTACFAAYCDHDHVARDWRHGNLYTDPVFQPQYDPFWFDDPSVNPAMLLVKGRNVGVPALQQLRHAADGGVVAHIPLLLASRTQIATPIPATCIDSTITQTTERTCVVIPTRDNPALLGPCVDSLLAKADRPDLLDIIVMSNRSARSETHDLLARLSSRPGTVVREFDEPFNWSRVNNIAAMPSDAARYLFLNDDTEMLSERWDSILASNFLDPKVGTVGARLLYPDGGIQHAGVIMGMNGDGPEHEGRWRDDAGPLSRWLRRRAASAVTGAFMAIPRAFFAELGGFDECEFIIAYNDIDMCLRIRERNKLVVYDPRIVLTHYESVSRGTNLSADMRAWDMEEWQALHNRWGQACLQDPGYNPNYVQDGYAFDGYRQPPLSEIRDHILQSAAQSPWTVSRARS